jgi:hypothetical protein
LCAQLQHTHALLLLLGNVNYLVQKMSSTVVSSLMTGVPIIADSQVLASYTFLKPEHVFLIGPGETEMDVMQRVGRGKGATVRAGAMHNSRPPPGCQACAACQQQDQERHVQALTTSLS